MRLSVTNLLHGGENAFWSTGNRPTQDCFGLTELNVSMHSKALALLSHRVFGSASFFFESSITRTVYRHLRPLFQSGDVLFFINEEYISYKDHGEGKRRKSPAGLRTLYSAERVKKLALLLEEVGFILVRPDHDISGRLREMWVQDVFSEDVGSIGAFLVSGSGSNGQPVRQAVELAQLADVRSGDFVWGAIEPQLVARGFPLKTRQKLQRRLAQLYAICMAETLRCGLDNPDINLANERLSDASKTDTMLFVNCLRELGLFEAFVRIDAALIIQLKRSTEWIWFKSLYHSLMNMEHEIQIKSGQFLMLFAEAEREMLVRRLTHAEFVRVFRATVRGMGERASRFSEAVDVLKAAHEALGDSVVYRFANSLEGYVVDQQKRGGTQYSTRSAVGLMWERGRSMMKGAKRILMLSANPAGSPVLRIDVENREIKKRIAEAGGINQLEVESEWAVRLDDLQGHLLMRRPQIIHFSGHGTRESKVILEDVRGEAFAVPPRALRTLMGLLREHVECVVLNCCYSQDQAEAIASEINHVIGTSESINDDAAIAFAYAFYRAFVHEWDYRRAFEFAVNEVELHANVDADKFHIFVGGKMVQ